MDLTPMLRVTVEIVPYGEEPRKRTLATLEIVNDGTGTIVSGNYVATIQSNQDARPRECRIIGYRRKERPLWDLVGVCLKVFGHIEI